MREGSVSKVLARYQLGSNKASFSRENYFVRFKVKGQRLGS